MKEDPTGMENINTFNGFVEKVVPYIRIVLLQWRKILIINTVIVSISIAILVFFVKNYYDSTVVILPNYGGASMLGGLSSLAAVAGLSVGETNPSTIYQKLLESETVLESVVYTKYQTKEYKDSVNLIEYFEIKIEKTDKVDPLPLQERDKFLQIKEFLLKKTITTNLDRITNILTITVRLPEQQLSSDVANGLIKSLDRYVRTKRKSNAKEQRTYIEERTNQVKDSLDIIEESLKKFREQNRVVLSPQLLLDQARLMRKVEIFQTVFVELTKQMELIKLEEVKDSPIINLQEEAGIPIKKAGPSRAKYLFFIFLTSLIISSGWYAYKDFFITVYSDIKVLAKGSSL